MTYTITKNANFGSIEIHFDGKPAQTVREALKALKFRWHGVRRVWYGYADAQTVQEAIGKTAARAAQPADGTEQAQGAKPGAEQTEQERLKSEYLQILAGYDRVRKKESGTGDPSFRRSTFWNQKAQN